VTPRIGLGLGKVAFKPTPPRPSGTYDYTTYATWNLGPNKVAPRVDCLSHVAIKPIYVAWFLSLNIRHVAFTLCLDLGYMAPLLSINLGHI
jgi:hypothetical protein